LRTRIREEMLRQAADWLAVKYAQRALKGSFMNAREAIQSATRLIKALTTWATVLPEKAQEPLIEALAAIAAKWWDDARGPRDKLAELVWADVDPPKSPEWVRTFFKQLANTYNNREDVARFLVLKCLRLARHPSLRKKFGAILEDIGKTNPRTLLEAMLQVIPTLTTEEIRSFQWVKDLFVKVIRKSSGKSRVRIVRNLLELVTHSIGKL